MELLIAFLAIAALGPLAARFGHDSRDNYLSREDELGLKEPKVEDRNL